MKRSRIASLLTKPTAINTSSTTPKLIPRMIPAIEDLGAASVLVLVVLSGPYPTGMPGTKRENHRFDRPKIVS